MYLTFDQIIGGSLPSFILILFMVSRFLKNALQPAPALVRRGSPLSRVSLRGGNVRGVLLLD